MRAKKLALPRIKMPPPSQLSGRYMNPCSLALGMIRMDLLFRMERTLDFYLMLFLVATGLTLMSHEMHLYPQSSLLFKLVPSHYTFQLVNNIREIAYIRLCRAKS